MNTNARHFELGTATESFLAGLGSDFKILESSEGEEDLTFWDTYDGRLAKVSDLLEVRAHGAEWSLRWNEDGLGLLVASTREGLSFGDRLPAGVLRQHLEPILGVRRLLPKVRVSRRLRHLALLNKDEKTVVRLVLEDGLASLTERWQESERPLPTILHLQTVRGYDGALTRVLETLEGLEISEFSDPPGQWALARLGEGLSPGLRSQPSLGTDVPAAEGLRLFLGQQWATLEAQEDGLHRRLDTEFLHEFRVALRRTRAVISQLKVCFPVSERQHFQKEFSWLGKVTGWPRDLDVYLLKMPRYRRDLPLEAADALAPLQAFLEERRNREQLKLEKALGSGRYDALKKDWSRFLLEGSFAPGTDVPLGHVLKNRLEPTFRLLLVRGEKIGKTAIPEKLHALRIRAKKLRYLLELAGWIVEPQELVRPLLKELKRLQDHLGDFNDFEVQQATLETFAREMAAAGTAGVDTFLALGRLLDRLHAGAEEERQRFASRFRRFATRENRDRFRALTLALGKE